jgi:hypothetical protein
MRLTDGKGSEKDIVSIVFRTIPLKNAECFNRNDKQKSKDHIVVIPLTRKHDGTDHSDQSCCNE